MSLRDQSPVTFEAWINTMKALYQAPSAERRRMWAAVAAMMADGKAPAVAPVTGTSDPFQDPMERHAEQAALAEILQQLLHV